MVFRIGLVAVCLAGCCWGPSRAAAQRARAPLAGFSPLVAMTFSNERRDTLDWGHQLHDGYVGSALEGDPSVDYAVGILDTGASFDLIGRVDSIRFDITGDRLSTSVVEAEGAAGLLTVPITQPLGVFAQGFQAVDANGVLDLDAVKGHSNVVAASISPDSDASIDVVPSIVGVPMLAFYTSVIRNDRKYTVDFNGKIVETPEVEIINNFDFDQEVLDDYRHSIAMRFLPLAITASYSGLDFDNILDPEPQSPTLLSISELSIPTGGGFFSTMTVGHGEIGPFNPVRDLNVLVDTGAQTSVISQEVAANMNLDLRNPDFEVNVEGIGGTIEGVPGFYVDFVRLNASGGAMEFESVPFVVIDLPNPDGGGGLLDGILGMNLFWNRNVIFEPNPDLTNTHFFHVSDPLYGPEVLLGDVDLDLDLDVDDIEQLAAVRGHDFETADPAIFDLTGDVLIDDADLTLLVEQQMGTFFGDANLDRRVDLEDFNLLKSSFHLADAGWAGGDFNLDGVTDLKDFATLKANFHEGGDAAAVVPEPASLLSAAIAGCAALGLARRRRG